MDKQSYEYTHNKEEELHKELISLWEKTKLNPSDKELKDQYKKMLTQYDQERQKQPLPF